MKTNVVWKSDMQLEGIAAGHTVAMDAKTPIGKGTAPTPKELVAMGLGGCTAMDVIAFLKKYKQPPQSLRVDVDIDSSTGGHPAVFTKAIVTFVVEGTIEAEKLNEAVKLSQTKYCGVSAMLSKSFPIEYRIILNGKETGSGIAKFESH
jgi:putative redox protein